MGAGARVQTRPDPQGPPPPGSVSSSVEGLVSPPVSAVLAKLEALSVPRVALRVITPLVLLRLLLLL